MCTVTPASRRLFLKLKDRFWRSKRVFMNVDDLTTNGLGFSQARPLKKRKYDLKNCLAELLDYEIISLGRGQTDSEDDRLRVEDLTAERVRAFLRDLEENRGVGAATRNQRLAAIHSLAHFIGLHGPEHLQWCGEIRTIMSKKVARPLVAYLEKEELDALLASPDRDTAVVRRGQEHGELPCAGCCARVAASVAPSSVSCQHHRR